VRSFDVTFPQTHTLCLNGATAIQLLFHTTPPVGTKGIDRCASGGAIEPAANKSISRNAGTAAVEPEENFGANLFGLAIALQHAPDDTGDALIVLPKDRFELRFYPAIAHANCFYTYTTTDGVVL
jgi:hypothetical protein